jgi:polycomb protein EED
LLFVVEEEVYDLKFHPIRPEILLAASADETICLFNISTLTCIACFHGKHLNKDVGSISFEPEGKFFASGDSRNFITIWSLTDEDIVKKIDESYSDIDREQFQPLTISNPLFRSDEVNSSWVDNLHWAGEIIISRSRCGDIVFSKANLSNQIPSLEKLLQLTKPVDQKDAVWFIRMDVSPSEKCLAVGEYNGVVSLWDLKSLANQKYSLKHQKSKHQVNMVSFSSDDKLLIAGNAKGEIFLFEKK